jgi:hypothetical protein
MPTREELQSKQLTELAALCERVADGLARYPRVDLEPASSAVAQKAQELKLEWLLLTASQTSQPPAYREEIEMETEEASLKKRMVEFLANLPRQFLRTNDTAPDRQRSLGADDPPSG